MSASRSAMSTTTQVSEQTNSPGPVPSGRGATRARVHSAFWLMVRRVTILAACVDLAFLVFFLAVGSPWLAWPNVISITMYGAAYGFLRRRQNLPALILIWTEVIVHATLGTLMLGWGSGFHYYLLMFIPAIMVSGGWRTMIFPLIALFGAYLGLHAASHVLGVMAPIGTTALWMLNVFNVAIFFAMASYTARFYYETVQKKERRLRDLAAKDVLTGLSNRRHLQDVAQQAMLHARRHGEAMSVVLADIDHFKQINDRFGHEAGDQVLIHVSQLFLGLCRPRDVVARWGGEEFLFLLPGTDLRAAAEFAERIRVAAGGTRMDLWAEPMRISISLGVAMFAGSESLDAVIGRADAALYQSKTLGRDRMTLAEAPHAQDLPAEHATVLAASA